jgi:AcrR family transcriptional regulator
MSVSIRMSAEDRRAAILDAAFRLFSERGFHGTTTRALAEAVGVTEPVLYEHFKSKRDLYAAIVEAKSREGMARGYPLLEPLAKAKDDRALFLALGRFVIQSLTEDHAYTRLAYSIAVEDPELGRIFYERQGCARDAIAGYIAGRIRDGAFRSIDPYIAARALLGMIIQHGFSRMLYLDRFVETDDAAVVEQMVDLFLGGIRK